MPFDVQVWLWLLAESNKCLLYGMYKVPCTFHHVTESWAKNFKGPVTTKRVNKKGYYITRASNPNDS
jgi:hypothetical protein